MKGIELRYDGNGNVLEPAVSNGIMAVGDTLRQNQALLLTLHKGELKERPSAGVGLSDMLLDNDPIYWRTEIKECDWSSDVCSSDLKLLYLGQELMEKRNLAASLQYPSQNLRAMQQ